MVDGDTLEIHGQRIRLWGIDAPESRQTCERGGETYRCGQQAALTLADRVEDKVVTCVPHGPRDRYRRVVAKCSVRMVTTDDQETLDFPRDIAAEMVVLGWAVDFPRYSGGEYADEEALARDSRSGVHAGTFIAPWAWRAAQRLGSL